MQVKSFFKSLYAIYPEKGSEGNAMESKSNNFFLDFIAIRWLFSFGHAVLSV